MKGVVTYMGEKMENRIKKLALAYGTGWEYRPGSEEAGSVLTDLFLQMAQENHSRFQQIWEKHLLELKTVTPDKSTEVRLLKTALCIHANGTAQGQWIDGNTVIYTVPEKGELIPFRADGPLQLTEAKLCAAIYQKGFFAWSNYEGGEVTELPLHQPGGQQIAFLRFRWDFKNLCNGREALAVTMRFSDSGEEEAKAAMQLPLPGRWSISDGQQTYPLQYSQPAEGCRLEADTPSYACNLEDTIYTLLLQISPEEELPEEWLKVLEQNIALEEDPREQTLRLCITDLGATDGENVLPFGDAPYPAACMYLAADETLARAEGEIIMTFSESYDREDKLPPDRPEAYKKLYKKYPWMQSTEEIVDWCPRETVWEYYNGSFWAVLPGSGQWKSGCQPENPGERSHSFTRPADMQPCMMSDGLHYYLRLRLCKVDNAYAGYYHKQIPRLEKIRLREGGHCTKPIFQVLPDGAMRGETKMYLGFDRELTPDNCWYTNEGVLSFREQQMKGWSTLFDRDAFWVELEQGEPYTLTSLAANYVEITMLPPQEGEHPGNAPLAEGTIFQLETQKVGVLYAHTVKDSDYGVGGSLEEEYGYGTEHYLSSFGRVVSPMDMELLLQEDYPGLAVDQCLLQEDGRELTVFLQRKHDSEGSGDVNLQEISQWLEHHLHGAGLLWLAQCSVCCMMEE